MVVPRNQIRHPKKTFSILASYAGFYRPPYCDVEHGLPLNVLAAADAIYVKTVLSSMRRILILTGLCSRPKALVGVRDYGANGGFLGSRSFAGDWGSCGF